MQKWILVSAVLVLFVIAFIVDRTGSGKSDNPASTPAAAAASSDSQQPSQEPSPEPSQKAEATAIVVEATDLVGEYDKNKLAAQDKYTGKLVQTTGYIKNISNDFSGNYYLALDPVKKDYYFGTTLQCFFKDKSELTSLENGQSVTVQGKMDDMSIGTVILKECQLIK